MLKYAKGTSKVQNLSSINVKRIVVLCAQQYQNDARLRLRSALNLNNMSIPKGKKWCKTNSSGHKVCAGAKGYKTRPGTSRGDAYCARSIHFNKPGTPGALARQKWHCKGKKSMK